MNSSIKVSVVIPVFNAEKLIERCLDSILNQNCGWDIEILAIDDGSTDGSLKILNEYPEPLRIFQQENLGPAAARNHGILKATGDYLAFLDADDYWLPEFLDTTICFLESHPSVIAVNVGQIHKTPGKKDVVLPSYLAQEDHDTSAFVLEKFFEFWNMHRHICTGSVVIRMLVAKESGGQLVDFRISQDLEYWSYLGTLGKWAFIPKILFVSDGGSVTKERGWLNKNLIRWKNTPDIERFQERSLRYITRAEMPGFEEVTGWLAFNFTYNHIMAGNFVKARQVILEYFNFFPKSKLSSFYISFAKMGSVPFVTFAVVLRYFQTLKQLLINFR